MQNQKQPSSGVRAKARRFGRRAGLLRRAKGHAAEYDDDVAFVSRAAGGHRLLDDDAEATAEEFLAQATSAEDVGEVVRDEFISEELGGPFLEVDARAECSIWFADIDDDDRVETGARAR